MQLLIQHEVFRKLLCSVMFLFVHLDLSFSKLMAFAGENANVIAELLAASHSFIDRGAGVNNA